MRTRACVGCCGCDSEEFSDEFSGASAASSAAAISASAAIASSDVRFRHAQLVVRGDHSFGFRVGFFFLELVFFFCFRCIRFGCSCFGLGCCRDFVRRREAALLRFSRGLFALRFGDVFGESRCFLFGEFGRWMLFFGCVLCERSSVT